MSDDPTIDWSEVQRQVRHAAAEAGEGAAHARLRRDAVAERLAELRAARGGEPGAVGEEAMSVESAGQAAEIARKRALAGLERSALAHDHSAQAHDRAASLAARFGDSDRGGWHQRAAVQERRGADEDRLRADRARHAAD
ncbi:MAG: hypothetical protein ACJ76X_04425 [Solirubrobacteraceae bacterium]|jgi:hypothetical protein